MIRDNFETVCTRVAAAARRVQRDPDEITLVAVSKTHPAAALREALAAGVVHLGENRVQEAAAKKPEVEGGVWHLIGPLQRNKAKLALELFDIIHTVDRPELADRLQRLMEEHWPAQRKRVLMEVNVGDEEQKAGVSGAAAADLLGLMLDCPALEIVGLMAIPPWGLTPEASRPYFQALRRLRDELEQLSGTALPELSMGMSQDFEVAIEEGATMVRVGTAIFGPRG